MIAIGCDFEVRPCEPEDLYNVIGYCLADVIIASNDTENKTVAVPTKLSLGYSDEGGLGLVIGTFLITCDNSPPQREQAVEIIKEVYVIMLEQIMNLPTKVGDLKVIPSEREEECELEVELHDLQ